MKKQYYICVILLLFVSPVNAAEIQHTDLYGISNPITENNKYIYYTAEGSAIKKNDILGGSYSDGVTGIPVTVSDVYVTEDYYYYICSNGIVYRTIKDTGLITFDSNVGTGNTISLSDIHGTTGAYHTSILVDDDGKIFVNYGDNIFYINENTQTSSTYYTDPDGKSIYSIIPSKVGLGINYFTYNSSVPYERYEMYNVVSSSSKSLISLFSSTYYDYPFGYALSNGDYIGASLDRGGTNLNVFQHNDTTIYSELISNFNVGAAGNTANFGECIVWPDGVVAVSCPTNSKVCTTQSYDDIGGFSWNSGESGDSGDSGDTSSSLITGDSHEYTNDEISVILRQYVPPVFMIVLLLFLMYAFGGN